MTKISQRERRSLSQQNLKQQQLLPKMLSKSGTKVLKDQENTLRMMERKKNLMMTEKLIPAILYHQ